MSDTLQALGSTDLLAPLNLGDYITHNHAWFTATYNVAVGSGWPPGEVVVHVEVLADDRLSTPCRTCRLGTVSEFVARSKYIWRIRNLWNALRDVNRNYFIALVTHADGRSYCLPLRTPAPGVTPPEDYVCVILSGYEMEC